MPTSSAARMTSVPLGTPTATPSTVRSTRSVAAVPGVAAAGSPALRRSLVGDGHADTVSFAKTVDAAGSEEAAAAVCMRPRTPRGST